MPHCYTGETLLVRAIDELGLTDKIGIKLKAFELDPAFPKGQTIDVPQCVARKYHCSMPEALEKIEYAAQMARAVGIDMKFRTAVFCNTSDAHRLLKCAENHYGRETALKLNFDLFAAYFTRNLVLDDENLIGIFRGAGLPANLAREVLDSGEYERAVLEDEQEARARGITAIPYFEFDGQFAINGATSLQGYREALAQMIKDSRRSKE